MQEQSMEKWRRLKMYVSRYCNRQRSLLTKLPPSYATALNTLSKYIQLYTHPWTHTYNTKDTHKPLNVTSCSRLYQWVILCSLASSGRTNQQKNKSHIEPFENGEITRTVTNLCNKVWKEHRLQISAYRLGNKAGRKDTAYCTVQCQK